MNCDFETYSECEIDVGAFRYAQDETTEILCIAYGETKEDIKLWRPGLPPPTKLIDHINSGGEIRGWNSPFEYAIFNYVGTRLGWPKVKIEQVRCTQAEALCLALPASLDQAAIALGTGEQKDKLGKSLIQKLCKPKKATKKDPCIRRTPENSPELFEQLYSYCIQDVKTEMDIEAVLPRKLKDQELEVFHLTLKMNERGLPIDTKLCRTILEAKAEYEIRLNKEIDELTGGLLESTGSRQKSMKWLEEQGVTLPGYTKGDVQTAITSSKTSDKAKRFLEIRSELSRTPVKKFDFIKNALCSDSTIKNNIIYHKATTGRFAGSGFQMHNLPRDTHKDPESLITKFKNRDTADLHVYNEAIKLTRSIVTAPKGKKLVVSDFASIENRITCWLAEDYDTLEKFEKGLDQYKDAAVDIFGVRYEDVTKDQRQLGKIAILSCCFGGGWKVFKEVCEKDWGIKISEDQAKEIVEAYRKKYWRVKNMWYGLYDAALEAIAQPGTVHTYNSLKLRVIDDFLYMRLPSGRLLAYYKPELKMVLTPWKAKKLAFTHMGTNTYTRKWERLIVIPGRLFENAVQATARDCLTEAMLRLEKANYGMIGCVHDENISLVDENFGSIEEYNNLMKQRPSWALDCPIECEGYEGARYKK